MEVSSSLVPPHDAFPVNLGLYQTGLVSKFPEYESLSPLCRGCATATAGLTFTGTSIVSASRRVEIRLCHPSFSSCATRSSVILRLRSTPWLTRRHRRLYPALGSSFPRWRLQSVHRDAPVRIPLERWGFSHVFRCPTFTHSSFFPVPVVHFPRDICSGRVQARVNTCKKPRPRLLPAVSR